MSIPVAKRPTVVITVNSPGEVAAWLAPVVVQLGQRLPSSRIVVVVPPCPFASGAEVDVIRKMEQVTEVIGPEDAFGLLFRRRRPDWGDRGLVLFLGGDPAFAGRLARRLGYPAAAYVERVAGALNFQQYFAAYPPVAEELRTRGKSNVHFVGNLMASAVKGRAEEVAVDLGVQPGETVLSFFPGSRPWQICHLVPFFLEMAQLLGQALVQHQLMIMSPFVEEEQLVNAASTPSSILGGITATCVERWEGVAGNKVVVLKTVQGHRVTAVWGARYELMKGSTLAVTIPGTNTAELGYLHVPTVVLVPLHRPEIIPLPGLIQWVGRIPRLGPVLKRRAVETYLRTHPYVALPNQWVGREIMPEYKGSFQAADVVCCLRALLEAPQRLESIRKQLVELAPTQDTASVMVELLIENLD